jgi:hypothetical protein
MKSHPLLLRLPILSLLALLAGAPLATTYAQGTAFTYQGRLDNNGRPANGSYDFQFRLYDAVTNGAQQGGPLTNAASVVSNGTFVITLDFGDQFTGANRWLEIAVRTNGGGVFTALNPRQQITAAPYAMRAANLTGTLPLSQLPPAVVTNGASAVSISGTFSGNGTGLTNVDLRTVNSQGAIAFATDTAVFALASSPATGPSTFPSSVTSADVNGDGKPDLISANNGPDTLTVLTNNGNGGFVLSSLPSVGIGPQSVVSADVNGDGKADLITANINAGTLTVLTNNGSGGFVLGSSLSVGGLPRSVTSADVNADGRADLISVNTSANTLRVFTNNGSAGFVLATSPDVGLGPQWVTSADVNADGRPDLISANINSSTLTVLTNNGSGSFVLAASPGVGAAPRSVASADVNGDGWPDLISANFNASTLTVLTNNGSGDFVTASSPAVGLNPYFATAADINGDDKPDLISANYNANTLTVLTNNGSGSFVLSSSPTVGSRPRSIASVDVNGDGRTDLISANEQSHTLTVLFNTTTTGAAFTGNGSGLTSLNASNLTGAVSPAALTSIPAGNLTGTVPLAQMPGSVVTNGASGVTLAGTFSGNGSSVSNVNAATLNGVSSSGFWRTNGNAGANPANGAFLGTTDNQPLVLKVRNTDGLRIDPATNNIGDIAPNLIGGAVNSIQSGESGSIIAGGQENTLQSTHAVISGGWRNQIQTGSSDSVIVGGQGNVISNNTVGATISGGVIHSIAAAAEYASVGGGRFNRIGARSTNAVISGGRDNLVGTNSAAASIGGGQNNFIGANAVHATVAGGEANNVSAATAFIGGGLANGAQSENSTIGGGAHNLIRDSYDAFGNRVSASWSSFIGGGQHNRISAAGVDSDAFQATIGGGWSNQVFGAYATIPGGWGNLVSGDFALAAGRRAVAIHDGAFVWADSANSTFTSTAPNQFLIRAAGGVGIGTPSPAANLHLYSANNPTVMRIQSTGTPGFGRMEFVSNPQGDTNEWRPGYIQSSDAGGFTGGLSFVVNGTGAANKFSEIETMRIQNGRVGIGTAAPVSALQVIGTVTATAFNPPSDRNLKENFAPVSPKEVLEKVAALRISRWNFKGDAATPHVGPMAQDFHAAFSLGTDERHIATVDADGVALAAIQGLNQKLADELKRRDAENDELKRELAELKRTVERLARAPKGGMPH